MSRLTWLTALVLLASAVPALHARPFHLDHQNRHLSGRLVDHTDNHGCDRRIWSAALGQRCDLYVYLPPGYDPNCRYPVMLWLHGISQDEQSFPLDGLRQFDAAMACGRLAPTIIVIPDGTINGRPSLLAPRTFFLNSNLGPFEDYLMRDVWGFVQTHYPIVPDRQAHVVAGFSGGGSAAYRVAIRYRSEFGVVLAVSAPLNVRWLDCHGRYFSQFNPDCWGWRTDVPRHESIGRFYGVINIRMGRMVEPLFGRGPDTIAALSSENPIEMLDHYDVRPGELAMFSGWGGRDQFNVGAQNESFVYHARARGLDVRTAVDPRGRHDLVLVEKFMPEIIDWLAPQLAPFSPALQASPTADVGR